MIAFVKGTIAMIEEESAVVEVNGFGIRVLLSADTISRLPGIGEEITVYTYTCVREDAFLLYGFLTQEELRIFKKLITVNGIGPKGGLAILSVMTPSELRFAVAASDAKAISKAPGIGTKTAQRLILDLKDKLTYDDAAISDEIALNQSCLRTAAKEYELEAVEALVALGYGQAESMKAVKMIPEAENMESGALLKAALRYLF